MRSASPAFERGPAGGYWPARTRYLLAAAIFLAALGLRLLLLPIDAGVVFVFFFPGAVVAALICGIGPTLAYILVSAPVAVFIFRAPYGMFVPSDVIPAASYVAAATTILLIVNFYQRLVARQTQVLRKLAQAVEQSPASVVITDLEANIEYVNQAFLARSGYEREEVLGRNIRLLRSGKTPRATYAAMWEALHQGHTWRGEFINRRKNDGDYVESAIITPLRQGDGQISHYVGVQEDVTERKRDAAELERHRHHLEELIEERTSDLQRTHNELLDTQFALENAGIAIHWVDAETGRFVHVNKHAAMMLGYTVAEMLELSVPDIDPNFNAERFAQNIARLRQQPGMQFETTNLAKDSGIVPVEATLYYLSGETTNCPARVVAFLTNLTQRKEAEAALLQAKQSAEAANVAKSAFLAKMSHEIRTPLHVMIGLAHLLRRDIIDLKYLERLDQLCANSDHLLSLINDILDLSKIEADRLVIDRQDFRLGAVIDRVVRMNEELARQKGLTLTAEVEPSVQALRLNGDPLRLAQVLINLCSNAVKYTEKGAVRLSIDFIAESPEGIELALAVADTGIGIAPDDQARLFQPFEQADNSLTRSRSGTGLGLAISQHLVTLMGGTLRVDSRLDAGTNIRFNLLLPRATGEDEPEDMDSTPAATVDFIGKHVLCVEDHPLSQEILLDMIESLGCVGDIAVDGIEAVTCAREHHYDVILMDMHMPVMDGLAATRAIRALPGHRGTPIIALTANAFAEDRQRCLDAGMNGHLSKPVTPGSLAAALAEWLPHLTVPDHESPPCENSLSRTLAEIRGLEIPSGWSHSPQRLADYCAQLNRLVTMHGKDMALLREYVATGNHDAARSIAHNLKGVAGLMGARSIVTLTSVIEQGLREGAEEAYVMRLVADCESEVTGLTQAVRALPVAPAISGVT